MTDGADPVRIVLLELERRVGAIGEKLKTVGVLRASDELKAVQRTLFELADDLKTGARRWPERRDAEDA